MTKEDYKTLDDEVKALLLQYEGREYVFGRGTEKETKTMLYYGNEALRDALKAIEKRAEALYDKESQKRHYPVSGLFKLINEKGTIGHFSVHEECKFRHVANADKVAKLLDKEVTVWANARRKRLKDTLSNKGISQAAFTQAMSELEREIESGKEAVKRLQKFYRPGNGKESDDPEYREGCFEGFEVRILSKSHAKYFGTLRWREGGKQKKAHLSILAPNVIIYSPESRSDDIVDAFMREAQIIVGDIFAKTV